LRPLESLPQAPQSRYPAAADPGPMNPEDNQRLSVYPHVEVEPTADVCPSGPARDAVDQGRDGRVIWAGSRSEPARQGRGRGRSFDSGHGNGPPAHSRKGPPASMVQSCSDARMAGTPAGRRDVVAERNLGRANERRGEMKSHTPAGKLVCVRTGLWAGGGRVANMAL
jgi:hypothetical protein